MLSVIDFGEGGREGEEKTGNEWTRRKIFLRPSHPRERRFVAEIRHLTLRLRISDAGTSRVSRGPWRERQRRATSGWARRSKTRDVYAAGTGGWILRILESSEITNTDSLYAPNDSLNLSNHLSNNQWHGRSVGKCNLLSCNETRCFGDGAEATYELWKITPP